MNFTRSQHDAIHCVDHNLQIIACAGSGKTSVVTERILEILRQRRPHGLTPDNIVAFTFTDKAAAELKDRITKLYRDEYGNLEGLAGMYVGTIHGFCLDLLERYAPQYLKYNVLDEVKQRLFIDRYYDQCGMKSLGLRRWLESNTYISTLSMLRNAEVVNDQVPPPVRAALERYQNLLDRHAYLDYDEQLLRAVVELLSNPALRHQVAERVRYVTVDEYQDINPIQEYLISQLHALGANLCVVGDDDQNIYQFRGSDVAYIVGFADRYPDVVPVTLDTNFRSTDAIVDVARRAVELNTHRLPKAMTAGGRQTFERGDLLALTFATPAEEAATIADKILAMRGLPYHEENGPRGLAWSDFAILLRSVKGNAAPIVAALRDRDIPFIITGLSGLFDTLEAQAASAIYRYLTREIDAPTLLAAWRDADLGLTPADLDRGLALLDDRRQIGPGHRYKVYNLQRVFLDFLEAVQLRDDRVPAGRGEIVFYNLGKFSQVLSDYETIHFKTPPADKYAQFVKFLHYQAPDYYPEGGQDRAYAVPDAVRIMTVHGAKGLQFPVVFLPALLRNRFPSAKQHNRVWNILPKAAIRDAARYDSSDEDERRLFYVAVTRSEKYLFASYAPIDGVNNRYRQPSAYFTELTNRAQVLTRDPGLPTTDRLPPQPRSPLVNVELSFSELKYLFECPYQFKLRFLYGFNAPLDEALGYGRSLHNALADLHRRALAGDKLTRADVPSLLDTHLHLPYAYDDLTDSLRNAGERALDRYLRDHSDDLDRLRHVEEDIQLTLPNGIVVNGRIDLIKRTDRHETAVVDFKSTRRAQAEDVTRLQLHVYAVGYQQRFGDNPDLIEVHNLDQGGSVRELVDNTLLQPTLAAITHAGEQLRTNTLPRLPHWCPTCAACDYAAICRGRPAESRP